MSDRSAERNKEGRKEGEEGRKRGTNECTNGVIEVPARDHKVQNCVVGGVHDCGRGGRVHG